MGTRRRFVSFKPIGYFRRFPYRHGMRLFVALAVVLLGTLASLAWWRGGDRVEPDAKPAAVATPPEEMAVKEAPSMEFPAEETRKLAESTSTEPASPRRNTEEARLEALRDETARAVHAATGKP